MDIISRLVQDNVLIKIGNYSALAVVILFLILFLLARKQKDNLLSNVLLIAFILLLLVSVISFMIHFAFISLDPIV